MTLFHFFPRDGHDAVHGVAAGRPDDDAAEADAVRPPVGHRHVQRVAVHGEVEAGAELRPRVDLVVAALEVVLLGAVEDPGAAALPAVAEVTRCGGGGGGAADLEIDRGIRSGEGGVAHVYLDLRDCRLPRRPGWQLPAIEN